MTGHATVPQFFETLTLNDRLSEQTQTQGESIGESENVAYGITTATKVGTLVEQIEQTQDSLSRESSNFEVTETDISSVTGLRKLRPIPEFTLSSPPQDSFVLLQKWKGVVESVKQDTFLATLEDLTSEGSDEEAEIPIEEIPSSDRRLLAPGSMFYWCIGYLDTLTGQRIRASEIRLRRLPTWSAKEIERAHKEAEEISELLSWK